MAINYAEKYQEAVIDGFYPNALYHHLTIQLTF